MKHLEYRWFLAPVLLLAACGMAAPTENEAAAVPAPDNAVYLAAAKAAVAEIEGAPSGSSFAGLSEPRYRAYVDQAVSLGPVLGSSGHAIDTPEKQDQFCTPAVKILLAYQFAGLKERLVGVTDPEKIKQITSQAVMKNSETSFEQIFPLIIFSAHCGAASIEFLEAFIKKLPKQEMSSVRLQGLAQVRRGIVQAESGLVTMASASDLDRARRHQVLAALAQRAGEFAVALSAPERQTLIGQLLNLAQAAPDDRAALQAAAKAIGTQPCGALCSL